MVAAVVVAVVAASGSLILLVMPLARGESSSVFVWSGVLDWVWAGVDCVWTGAGCVCSCIVGLSGGTTGGIWIGMVGCGVACVLVADSVWVMGPADPA